MSTLSIIVSLYAVLLLARAGLALRHAASLAPDSGGSLDPGILTVVQPILGGDPFLESRLRETLSELPRQRFLWMIDEDDLEGRRVASALAGDRIRVELCPPCPERTNPKAWKLRLALPLVGTPFLAVLDDDTVLAAKDAVRLVAAARGGGVATGLPCYEDNGDGPSELLAQFVNNNAIFTYLGTAALHPPFTLNGMGYVMRLGELERIGGFDPILGELTDDLALASRVLCQGGTIAQETAVLRVRTGVAGWRHYLDLMHRWYVFTLLLLRRQGIGLRLLIVGLHGPPPLLLLAAFVWGCAIPLFDAPSGLLPGIPLLIGMLLMRSLVLVLLQRRFYGRACHRPGPSILSELLQPFHFLHALCSRTIRWRTRRYRVRDNDDFSPA